MATTLTAQELRYYRERGYLPARPALSADEVAHYRGRLESFEAVQGTSLGSLPGQLRAKTHLLFTWMDALVRQPVILDAVEGIIGPDILVYHLTCWIKEPDGRSYVSWHQDGTYFNLEPHEHLTAWLALSEADETSGCMQVVPGSQLQGQLVHVQGPTEANLLSNGQMLGQRVAEADAVLLPVPTGHFSLHHTHLVHASPPNRSDDRRIGFGISYIPTRVRHTSPSRQTAMLVRGEDRFGHFDPEVPPEADFHAAARACHARSCALFFEAHGSTRTAAEG